SRNRTAGERGREERQEDGATPRGAAPAPRRSGRRSAPTRRRQNRAHAIRLHGFARATAPLERAADDGPVRDGENGRDVVGVDAAAGPDSGLGDGGLHGADALDIRRLAGGGAGNDEDVGEPAAPGVLRGAGRLEPGR